MLRLIANESSMQKLGLVSQRLLSTKATTPKKTKAGTKADIPGLSDKCFQVPNTSVGPGAAKNKEYKNPEYFCYHIETFGEAEVELAKYRLPPPSNKKPFKQ